MFVCPAIIVGTNSYGVCGLETKGIDWYIYTHWSVTNLATSVIEAQLESYDGTKQTRKTAQLS